ncbi:MAG: hypothetical protein ABJG78_09400 [Cyclobacteriaceae bacterium]
MNKFKSTFLVGLVAITLFQCSQSEQKKEYESYPVLETMGYYQRFSHKLWLAGTNENWELADFYTHELEEVTERLIEGDLIHDDYNLSNLSESLFLPKIEKVEEAIKEKDEVLFREHYELMLSGCNLCHQATQHAFIRISIPTDTMTFNQVF